MSYLGFENEVTVIIFVTGRKEPLKYRTVKIRDIRKLIKMIPNSKYANIYDKVSKNFLYRLYTKDI
jgi:hypothetical protein